MNKFTMLVFPAMLAGISMAGPVSAAPPTTPTKDYHVRNLMQEGPSICDIGSWSYTVTWTPITHLGKPWPSYTLKTSGCLKNTYTCTATKCTAEVSSCSTRVTWSWTGVTADIGRSISGMRTGSVGRPQDCK